MDSMYARQEIPAVSSWLTNVCALGEIASDVGVPSSLTPKSEPDSNSR